MHDTAIVWFRQDLRLHDNPALHEALSHAKTIIPLYIHDTSGTGYARMGAASQWWLHHSLTQLSASLGTLLLRSGNPQAMIPQLIAETGATAVYWNRCYEPHAITRDEKLKSSLKAAHIEAKSFNGSLLMEPWDVTNKSGEPFKVFTPFWKHYLAHFRSLPPLPTPNHIPLAPSLPTSEPLTSWRFLPTTPDWAQGLRDAWTPGETGALSQLDSFIDARLPLYKENRDRPDIDATSRLSPHLHFGELSPRTLWHRMAQLLEQRQGLSANIPKFLSELGWREFSAHLLYHFPHFPERNYRPEFDAFPWQPNPAHLTAWQKGLTGYPLVDVGMRELWATGTMHNRVRMITASFLIKHLLQDWRAGQAWFWDTLVDADLANNAASWQWVAGSGVDAAPYFRIFNPILQGAKFDPDGNYTRRWLPELASLETRYLFAPWQAPAHILAQANILLGKTYPHPIVNHEDARARALAAFKSLKDNPSDAAQK